MAGERTELLVVLGSVTPPGRLRRVLDGALERPPAGIDAGLLDLADLELGFVGAANGGAVEAAVDAVGSAGAVVFATPVYRGSMTGALKNLFDALPVATLERKPVGLVAMGASRHHFLGAERHLRDVLAFFGALVAPAAVYLESADFEDGVPGARARQVLDELLAGVVTLARAVPAGSAIGPQPLGAAAAP
jgi:FMN reductase